MRENQQLNANGFFEILIDKIELAERLNVSVSFINKLMAEEGLPYKKLGRSVRFKMNEVAAWLEKRSMP